MERPLSAARKTSFEERDSDEVAYRVRQAIQRENTPVQKAEIFSRNTVCLVFTTLLASSLDSGCFFYCAVSRCFIADVQYLPSIPWYFLSLFTCSSTHALGVLLVSTGVFLCICLPYDCFGSFSFRAGDTR